MSHNLIFASRVNHRFTWEDFPFQTPTELTRKVIAAEGNLETQWTLVRDFIRNSSWWDSEEKQRLEELIQAKLAAGWRFKSN